MKALLLVAMLSGLTGGASAATGDVEVPVLHLTGDLQPRATVKVFARAAGMVEKVNYRESALVREGDVLASIDSREYEIEVAEARAAAESAEARVGMMDAGGRPEERARAVADIAAAEAMVRDAEANQTRMHEMFGKGGVSRQQLDAAQRELDVNRAKLTSARKSSALVIEGVREEERRMARADLARTREQLRMAELKLSYCKVLAPFTGVVGQRLVDPGTYVMAASSPQAPALFVFSDSYVMKGMLDVPESQLMLLRVGQKAKVTVQSLPDRVFEGTVVNVYPYVDQRTRTGKVELAVPNSHAELLSGMFIKADIDAASARAASLVEVLGVGVKAPAGRAE